MVKLIVQVTVTTGTGAWESGGTSFNYIDLTTSAPIFWCVLVSFFHKGQRMTLFPSTKVVMTFQVITNFLVVLILSFLCRKRSCNRLDLLWFW